MKATVRDAEVAEVRDRLDTYLVLDVREEYEFDGPLGHVEGAVRVPLGAVAEAVDTGDVDRPLLMVCRSGRRSRAAGEQLVEAGLRDVTNLAGGMIAWNEAGLPVQRAAPGSIHEWIASLVAYLAQVTPASRDEVERSLAELLERAGSSRESPSTAALESALNALAEAAREPTPPADLDLALAAYRRDLAVL